MDDSSMSDGAQLTTTVALKTTTVQNSGLDDSAAYSLVSTSEPTVQAVKNQLSLTLDVTIDGEENMQVSLANQTGFFAAYKNDVHV